MDSQFWSQLVVLLIVAFAAGCIGFILGSFMSTAAYADRHDPFVQPEFEHECDAHYPHRWE